MLLVVCIWLGLNKGDSSLEHGKNILYFLALYMLGNRINFYLRGDVKIDKFKLIIAYIILNILIVLTYLATGLMMQSVIIKLCFMYCSPLLLLNALLMFLIFTNIKFENIFVNKVAKSTYSMYIIHNSPVVLSVLISPIITKIWAMGGGKIFLLVNLIVLTLIIMCMCYLIDSIIRPFMNKYASKASVYIIEKLSSDR
jgi:peptidoglycan/LPS O-acetylase OafA/YrhL